MFNLFSFMISHHSLKFMALCFYVIQKDGRNPAHSGYKWLVTADVESLAWDPHTEHMFVVCIPASCTDLVLKILFPGFTIHSLIWISLVCSMFYY